MEKEPGIIREVLDEWNVTDAERQGIVALPIGWETHASPALGQRPQEIINHQVLEKADVLVAVFWTRLGTRTGDHVSGTVEEINESRKANRPTMVYFSNAVIKPNEINSEQHEKLKAFRMRIETEGLHGSFESLEEFRTKFRRDIRNVLQDFAQSFPVHLGLDTSTNEPGWERILSEDAKRLLMEAVQDPQAQVLCVRSMQGLVVLTNRNSFCENGNPRSEAKWKEIVQELIQHELLEGVGYEGEVFRVTNAGFSVADSLKAKN